MVFMFVSLSFWRQIILFLQRQLTFSAESWFYQLWWWLEHQFLRAWRSVKPEKQWSLGICVNTFDYRNLGTGVCKSYFSPLSHRHLQEPALLVKHKAKSLHLREVVQRHGAQGRTWDFKYPLIPEYFKLWNNPLIVN